VGPRRDRSGQSDFDFEFGSWKAHLARRQHPLSGSDVWTDYEGTSTVRKIWDGRANLGELEVEGRAGHIEGLSLRLYDPTAHAWNISFASSRDGALTTPLTGGFEQGRGEFFDHETLEGRPICVRFVFSDIAKDSFRFEQAFSGDGGQTWEVNWISTFTRVVPEALVPLSSEAIRAVLDAPDRTDADRKLDTTRHPAALLAFFGVGEGMRVADLGAGFGYTTELLARAVGPKGRVYSQDDPDLFKNFLQKAWAARLGRSVNGIVNHADRTFDDPLPSDAKNLDLVVNYIFYHDTATLGTDREKMNRAIFAALKPGGLYIVADASAKEGRGVSDARTLHRIERSVVETEVTRAGFTLAATADFLRNPRDTRDWDSSTGDRVGTEDRFLLKFTRP
jgi:predicted methyltransferase